MDEKRDNDMDRELADSRMELVAANGEHIAWVTKVYPGDMNPIAEYRGQYFMRVNGLRNVWRETYVSRVSEL